QRSKRLQTNSGGRLLMSKRSRLATLVSLLALASIFLFSAATNASAATITVTRTDDRNATCNPGVDCSLREAVTLANSTAGDDTINFNLPLPSTITLTQASGGELLVTSNITFAGPGRTNLTISGNNTSRA